MSNSKVFGYVRVSSKDQNLDRQFESLKQYVPDERDIYADKQSGKDFNRPAYLTTPKRQHRSREVFTPKSAWSGHVRELDQGKDPLPKTPMN